VDVVARLTRRSEVTLVAVDGVRFPRGGENVAGRESEATRLACWSHVKIHMHIDMTGSVTSKTPKVMTSCSIRGGFPEADLIIAG
jgi:hypothetical protein